MVLTVSDQDAANLVGGAAAVDSSIRKRLPGALTYSGLQPTSGGKTATFTVAFESPTEYKKEIAELLTAGGENPSDVEFSVGNSTLVHGMTLNENFTSYNLLKWMFDGLVTDGVVPASDSSNMYSLDGSVVNYGSVSTKQGSTFNFTGVQNDGFDAVTMKTNIADPRHVTRTITYESSADQAAANKDLYAKFLAESTPRGAHLKEISPISWTITFSGEPAVISANTTIALGGGQSEFALHMGESPRDPSEKILSVTDTASCDAVCANQTPITDTVTTGTGYTPKSSDIDTTDQQPTTFIYAPPITSVSSVFQAAPDGGITGTFKFVVPKASADAAGNGFEKRFKPATGVGTITTAKDDKSTVYTVSISGNTSSDFASKFKKWSPASSFTVSDLPSSGPFTQDTEYDITPALASLTGNHAVTGGTTSEVTLPFGQWVTLSGDKQSNRFDITGATVSAQGADAKISFRSAGPTVGGMLLAGFIAIALAIALFVIVRRRRTVMKHLTAAGSRVGGVLARQGSSLIDRAADSHASSQRLPDWSAFAIRQPTSEPTVGGSLLKLAPPNYYSSPDPVGSVLDIRVNPSEPSSHGSLFDLTETEIPITVTPRFTLLN
jgi:hypothetical protein